MGYKEFKKAILEELTDFYGKDADAITIRDIEEEGRHYEGIDISLQDNKDKEGHAINLSALYDRYAVGDIDMCDCVEAIYKEREGQAGYKKE